MPEEIWNASANTLALPNEMVLAYKQMLKAMNLYDTALECDTDDGPVGGRNEDAAKQHLAKRFAASAARTQLSILDPESELDNASDLFVRAFSGGSVGLLDIPAGAGAATIALLSTVAKLREKQVLPRQPLYVKLVCGDISEHARAYAAELVDKIYPSLKKQCIYVTKHMVHWDVCDSESTTAILHEWMRHAPNCREYFVVMANFSGFLQMEGKFSNAQPQLDEIFRWAAQRRSTVLWLEPQTNIAIIGFLPRLVKWLERKLPRIFRTLWDKSSDTLKAQCRYFHPIKESTPRVNLCLIRLQAIE